MTLTRLSSNFVEEGNATNRAPKFNGAKYMEWKNRMTIHIKRQDITYWKVIVNGPKGCKK